jgi:hypothetical protein
MEHDAGQAADDHAVKANMSLPIFIPISLVSWARSQRLT